ncbi:UNVERIFIED_CONTAM: hypothetical protein RMT77_005443 [Armadillidium vulgare]
MGNVISGRKYSNRGVVREFCCGCSLRTGSLVIGWFGILYAVLWMVNIFMFSRETYISYLGIASITLGLIAGIFILIGVYNRSKDFTWIGVYLYLVIVIYSFVIFVLFCLALLWPSMIIALFQTLLFAYFFFVLRSYAYRLSGPVNYLVVNKP